MFHKPSDIRLHVAERSRGMPALLRYPIQPSNHLGYVIGPIGEMAAPSWFSSSSNQLEEITAGGMKLDSQVSQLVQAMATYSASNSGFDPTAPASMLLQMTAAFRQLCQQPGMLDETTWTATTPYHQRPIRGGALVLLKFEGVMHCWCRLVQLSRSNTTAIILWPLQAQRHLRNAKPQ
jgi:hypothetical protein